MEINVLGNYLVLHSPNLHPTFPELPRGSEGKMRKIYAKPSKASRKISNYLLTSIYGAALS